MFFIYYLVCDIRSFRVVYIGFVFFDLGKDFEVCVWCFEEDGFFCYIYVNVWWVVERDIWGICFFWKRFFFNDVGIYSWICMYFIYN